MAAHYYLISSLPALELGGKPALSMAAFMETCAAWLSPGELSTLKTVSAELPANDAETKALPRVALEWFGFETCLRNRLAKARAGELNKDPERFIRPEKEFYSMAERGAQDALAAPNPLARENVLDQARWKALDYLEFGHLFDFDKVCLYKIRLELAEKVAARDDARGKDNFSRVLDQLYDKEKTANLARS